MNILTDSDSFAERGLLSTIAKDANLLSDCLEKNVDETWFTEPIHAKIWQILINVEDKSDVMDIDVILSIDEEDRDEAEEIMHSCDTAGAFKSFFDAVEENHRKRSINKIALNIQDRLMDKMPSSDVLENADKELTALSVTNQETTRSAEEVVDSMFADLLKQMESNGMSGIPSGIKKLDIMTGGWKENELVVVAARTSVGKTAFGCELSLAALEDNKKVLFFSQEMKAEAVMQRLIANIAEVPLKLIIDKTASKEQKIAWQKAMDYMKKKDLWIDDRGSLNSAQVRAKARKFKRGQGLDVIVLDYIQRMAPMDGRVPREQQVAEMVTSLKNLGMELNIPIIALAQLNRGADELNREPRLSDLRDSGAIEQESDVVLLLWRKNDDPAETVVSVAKQRQGPIGPVPLTFNPQIQKFTYRVEPTLN